MRLTKTSARAWNSHEKASQEAILSYFQGLAEGEPRKSPKQSRKRLPGSHSEAFSEPGWGGPQEEAQKPIKHLVKLRLNRESKLPNL